MIGPHISIILPCYNAAQFLDYAFMSLASQSYGNFEVVVVNDGSTDDTLRMVRKARGGLKIKLVDLKTNRGLPAALNAGMRAASGDFIARFDPDDFMLDWRLRDQVIFLSEHPAIDMVGGGARLFGVSSGEYSQRSHHDEIINEFLVNNPFIHPTLMFRRKLIDSGMFHYREDLTNDEDYELWSRILPKVRTANLHYPVIKYRIHGSNAQRNPGKKAAKKIALQQFLQSFGHKADVLADALAEFQCSQFMSHEGFEAAKAYVARGQNGKLPRLGWLHDDIVAAKNYAAFMSER